MQNELVVNTRIRSYVAKIDGLIDLFRAGERSRFSVISLVTQLLNADDKLSPEERAQSFKFYMAEIGSVPETPEAKERVELSLNQHSPMSKNLESVLTKKKIPEEDLVMGNHRHLNQEAMDQERGESCISQICLGVNERATSCLRTPAALNHPNSSGDSSVTSNQPNCLLNSHLVRHEESQCQNGSTYSRERQSTSTKYCHHSIVSLLIQRERLALEIQRLALAELKQNGKLRQALNGLLPGDPLRGRLLSCLSTGSRILQNTGTISKGFLQPNDPHPMSKLSYLTEESGMKLGAVKPCYSQTIMPSNLCTPPLYRKTESNIARIERGKEVINRVAPKMKFVSISMDKLGVTSQTPPASTVIPVWDVAKLVTEEQAVSNQTESEVLGLRPKYMCHNLWMQDADPKVTVATWTHTARPLHRPPQAEFDNLPAIQTIKSRSDLFKIVTPVKVSVLRHLTLSHPNRPFVDSVLEGLTNGFWPWANTIHEGYPVTHDESKSIQLTPEKEEFLRNQIQHERELGRVSDSFGKYLLPGMYCMPHYVVPKPHSTEWRLVNDLSAGPFSLNSMVDRQYISCYPLDNLSHLGEMLLRRLKEKPSGKFVVWKSDISEAYRICPMHKLWQLKQAVRFEGELSVDRVNMFGGSPSGAIFISVNSLVAWITKFKRTIKILEYFDESFGVSESGEISYYSPYEC